MASSTQDRILSRGAVLAVIVALLLGAAAGGVVEHQRAKDSSDKPAARSATTTTAVATSTWFGAEASAVCPDLQQWYRAVGHAVYALHKKVPWATTRATLLQQAAVAESSYRSMIPLATPAGSVELNFLLTTLMSISAQVKTSTSAALFAQPPQQTETSVRLSRDYQVIVQSGQSCAAQ